MLNVFLDPFSAIAAAHRTVIDNAGQLTGQVGLHLFVLLLGPQIGYTKGDFEKEAAGRFPVEVINMVDYGRMNAAGIIDHCVSVMG